MTSVRLKPEIDKKLREVAALKGLTLSDVYREALEAYCERELEPPRRSRYADIVGVGEGEPHLATCAHEVFGDIMMKKYAEKT